MHDPHIPDPDSLISSATARKLADVSLMTIWRWVKADILPEPLNIRGRNYWRRGEYLAALAAKGRK